MDNREIITAMKDFDSFLKKTNSNKSVFMQDINLGVQAASAVWDQWRILQDKLFRYVDELSDNRKKTAVDKKIDEIRKDINVIGNRSNPNFLLIPHLREGLSSLITLVESCK